MTINNKLHFADGVHNITNAQYHGSDAVSRSALWELNKTPFHYHTKYILKTVDNEQTPAMLMGELLHTMVLEPSKVDERFVVSPKFNKKSNAGKAEFNEFEKLCKSTNKTVIESKVFSKAEKIANGVKSDNFAMSLIQNAKIEQSIFWTDKETGIQCKARPDSWLGSIVTDFKTTEDASLHAFKYSCKKYGYFLQAGMIYEALKSQDIIMSNFTCLCVEKTAPYAIGIYVFDNEVLDFGIEQFRGLLRKLAECKVSNEWPSYDVQTMSL